MAAGGNGKEWPVQFFFSFLPGRKWEANEKSNMLPGSNGRRLG